MQIVPPPQLIVVDKTPDIDSLQKYLDNKSFIAYDCETTGLYKSSEVIGFSICAEGDKAYYVILSRWDAQENKLQEVCSKAKAASLIESLQGKNLIMHNGTFDCMMAESFFKVRLIDSLHTDTMILAHLLDENRRVGLKELSAQYFGEDSLVEQKEVKESITVNGGKTTKAQYDLYKADPYVIAKYGAKDALLTFNLFHKLLPVLAGAKLTEFFYDEETMPLLRGPTYDLNTVGIRVDLPALTSLRKTLEAECLELKDFIYKEIANRIRVKYPGTSKKNTFNIGASSQIAWLLFSEMSLDFSTLTKGGKVICKKLGMKLPYTTAQRREFFRRVLSRAGHSCPMTGTKFRDPWHYIAADKKALEKHASKVVWVKKLLEYQRKTKVLNTYIKGIESRSMYGVIQPSFLQHGTTSGRYSSRNPNFQNLPRDDKRVKNCIIARPGKVFVGADYSQLEPRVFASISGDERLQKAFKSGDDFYSTIGMETFDKYDCTPHKEGPEAFGVKYKSLRDDSKVIALASTYGATAWQLCTATGKSIEDTQDVINTYFERFPKVKEMMEDSHRMVKSKGYVKTIFGRPRRLPDGLKISRIFGDTPHADLPYDCRKILNLSVNHRIQGTGASIVNRSAVRFHNNCKLAGIMAKLVMQVHDSLVVECDEKDAEDVSILLQDAMENTVSLPGVHLEAIPKIGNNLGEV